MTATGVPVVPGCLAQAEFQPAPRPHAAAVAVITGEQSAGPGPDRRLA